jgi:hypothetical protein
VAVVEIQETDYDMGESRSSDTTDGTCCHPMWALSQKRSRLTHLGGRVQGVSHRGNEDWVTDVGLFFACGPLTRISFGHAMSVQHCSTDPLIQPTDVRGVGAVWGSRERKG